MALAERIGPAGKDIVSEEIDGEVVIVNLNNGNYYSLTQSAAAIWAGIQQSATLDEIRDRLHRRYSGDDHVIDQALAELIQALEAEQLIVRSPADSGATTFAPTPADTATATKEAFMAPVFERFTDMGDLLLLDPVHETEGDKGWPHPRQDA